MGMLKEIAAHKLRFAKTVSLYMAFVASGLSGGVIGPTILDLQLATGVPYDRITLVIPFRSGGYALGSVFIGIVFNRVNPLLCNFIALLLAGLSGLYIPQCDSLTVMLTFQMFNGFVFGMVDAISNLLVLHIWGKENQPFMQALHFCIGVGGLIAPLIASPYLLPLQSLLDIEDGLLNSTASPAHLIDVFNRDDLMIQTTYSIIALFTFFAAFYSLYLFIFHRDTPQHSSRDVVDDGKDSSSPRHSNYIKLGVVVGACLFIHVYQGMKIAMGSLLTTFAVKCDLKMSKVAGAYLTSVFWGTFMSFRLVPVLYIERIGSYYNLVIQLALVLIANVFLVPFGNSVNWCLWTGVAILGIGLSSIYASIFGFLEDFMPVTGRIASSLTVASCLGSFVFPFLMSSFVDTYPQVFLWIIFGCTTACCVLFAIISQLCRWKLTIAPDEQTYKKGCNFPEEDGSVDKRSLSMYSSAAESQDSDN